LQKTVLSTADVARLFNVTETTVKRWADDGTLECQKTPGGHRKFLISSVVDFAEKNNFEPVGTLELPKSDKGAPAIEMAVLSRDFSALAGAYMHKALSPDRTDLIAFLSYLYEHRIHLWEIFDLVVQPGMRMLGEQWEKGQLDISHEHRASHETLEALSKLQTRIKIKPDNGKKAIFACPGDEMHEIGLRCASYLFESEGWTTHYLGARTPVSAIVLAMKELKPDVVCMSLTYPVGNGHQESQLKELSSLAHTMHAAIVVGGIGSRPTLVVDGYVDRVLSSSKDVVDFITGYGRNEGKAKNGK
jgi:MerR family transcriptional regulator, light-induced transcriptional regulator